MSYNNINDYYNLAKYAAGSAVISSDMPVTDGAGLMLGLGAVYKTSQGSYWLMKNRKDLKGAWNAYKLKGLAQKTEFQALKSKNIFETARNMSRNMQLKELAAKYKPIEELSLEQLKSMSKVKQLKYFNKAYKSEVYSEVRKLIEGTKGLKGKELSAAIKNIDKEIAKANLYIHQSKLIPATQIGKIAAKMKKITGMNFINGKTMEWATKSSKFRYAGNIVKKMGSASNILYVALSLFTKKDDIKESFKNGLGTGVKQVLYSSGQSVAGLAGYAAGMKVGAMAGAAIGTIFPGIGNVVGGLIGGAIGLVGGIVAGNLSEKAYKAVLGKEPIEKIRQNNTNEMMALLKTDEGKAKVLQEISAKLDQEQKDNPAALETPEYKAVLQSYNNIVDEMNGNPPKSAVGKILAMYS